MKSIIDRVSLFIPCGMDMFQSETALNVMTVLDRLGIHYLYDTEQTCCGRRFYMEGEIGLAKELGDKLMNEYDKQNEIIRKKYRTILPFVVPDCACAGYIKKYFRQLLENSGFPQKIKIFTDQVYELCDYIVNYQHCQSLGNLFSHRVFYFQSCAARNLYPSKNAPEILLSNTKGLDLIQPELQTCCGANGRFNLTNPEAAEALTREIVDKAYAAGAQYITSTDIHCIQQIDAYVKENDIGVEVVHIADILKGEND